MDERVTPYRDASHFDRLQDQRAEHAGETGEPLTLAEAVRRLVQDSVTSSPSPSPSRPSAWGLHQNATVADDISSQAAVALVPHTTTNPE